MKLIRLAIQTKMILLAGIVLTGVTFKNVWDRELTTWRQEFEQEIIEDMLILNGEMAVVERELLGIVNLYNSSEAVTRKEFTTYVSPLLANHPFIRAFEWIPRVTESERETLKRVARSEGLPNFNLQPDPSSQSSALSKENPREYFPVLYAEPLKGNESTLGYDLSSDPDLFRLLQTSGKNGSVQATTRFFNIPNVKSRDHLLILAPFYSDRIFPAGEHPQPGKLEGFVLGIYTIRDMIDQMISPYLPKGVHLAIYEENQTGDNQFLFGERVRGRHLETTMITNIANVRLFLLWQATKEFRGGPKSINAFWAAASVIGIALLLATVFEMMASRTRQVENQVRLRTEELTTANRKLVELNDLKNKFLGMASHDLRSPLASIGGYSKYLLDKGKQVKDDTRQEFLNTIHKVSTNMLDLITNLLDISVIESGKLNLQMEPGSMQTLVEERVHIHQILAEKKNIILKTDLQELMEFRFDNNRMGQVIDNLIGNAIKFSPGGKSIAVRLEQKGTKARFSVQDEGPGISSDEQGRLFQHFQKLSAKPTGGENSSGLGLAIAQKIVEEHQGTIGVQSRSGSGSTFYFELPMENEAAGIRT